MIKLAITGACGRMGGRVAALATQDQAFQVVSVLERSGHPDLGKDYGSLVGLPNMAVSLSDTLEVTPDVLIDFSSPESTRHWVDACAGCRVPMVIGTTGLTDKDLAQIRTAAQSIPIVQAPNMSIGMNLLFRVVEQMARALGESYDVEIVEQHHRFKKDAPSGSALGLLDSVARGFDKDPKQIAVFGRQGRQCLRQSGEVAVHALRLGDTVGEHAVYFGTLGETVAISHSAHSRDTFAQGGLRAAAWVVGKSPGLYSMQDVLFSAKE